METPSPPGRALRYTVEYGLTQGGPIRVRAITPAGETMAVALATARLLMLDLDAGFVNATVVEVEMEWSTGVENDAIDYWNMS